MKNIELKDLTEEQISDLEKQIKEFREKKDYEWYLKQVKPRWYFDNEGGISEALNDDFNGDNYPTEQSAKQAAARIKVEVMAAYLNGKYEEKEFRFYAFWMDTRDDKVEIQGIKQELYYSVTRFNSMKAAQECLEVLGEKTIKEYLGYFED